MVGEGGDWGCENALGIATQVTSGWGRGFGEGIGEFEEELRGEEWNGRVRGAWSGPAGPLGREGSMGTLRER